MIHPYSPEGMDFPGFPMTPPSSPRRHSSNRVHFSSKAPGTEESTTSRLPPASARGKGVAYSTLEAYGQPPPGTAVTSDRPEHFLSSRDTFRPGSGQLPSPHKELFPPSAYPPPSRRPDQGRARPSHATKPSIHDPTLAPLSSSVARLPSAKRSHLDLPVGTDFRPDSEVFSRF